MLEAKVVDVFKLSTDVDGQKVYINIVDTSGIMEFLLRSLLTSGQEELADLRAPQIEANEGFLFAYSVNDRRGLEELKV